MHFTLGLRNGHAFFFSPQGEPFFSPSMAKTLTAFYLRSLEAEKTHDPYDDRTGREREVMGALEQRLCDKEIAARLRIEPSTGHTFIRTIFRKWGIHKRSEAVDVFRRLG